VDFRVTHGFSYEPDDVATAILDKKFQASLAALEGLKERRVLSQKKEDGVLVRRVLHVLELQAGGMAKRFLGDGDPAWVEVATWQPQDKRWTWVIEPEVGGDLLEAHGTTTIAPSEGGSTREVAGLVKVKVPFYGGKVEGWIVNGLRSAYDEEAGLLETWLSTGMGEGL
jgi:hypothetical protein